MASEMTNEELAKRLEVHAVPVMGCVGSSATGREIAGDIREAAARLRLKQQSDNYAAALCKKEGEYKREICDIRRRLKVAEDAMASAVGKGCSKCALVNAAGSAAREEIHCYDETCTFHNLRSALITIRKEGDAPNKNTLTEFRLYHKVTFKNGNSNGWILDSTYENVKELKFKIGFMRSYNDKYGKGKKIEFKVEVRNVTDWVDVDLDAILENAVGKDAVNV